jgi:hypothetical protein
LTKQALELIKNMCTGEIDFRSADRNTVTVLVPYDSKEIEVLIEGTTTDEQVNSFVSGVNFLLDEMINHLEEVKLSFIE